MNTNLQGNKLFTVPEHRKQKNLKEAKRRF